MRFLHHTPTAIGLDLGDRELKIAALDTQSTFTARTTYTLRLLEAVPLPTRSLTDPRATTDPVLERTIHDVMRRLGERFHGRLETIIGIPESHSFLFTTDDQASLALDAQVTTILEREVPIPTSDLYVDSQRLPKTHDARIPKRIIGAAPKAFVDRMIALTEGAGLTVAALDFEALATARAILRAMPRLTHERWLLIDFGATRTQCAIIEGEAVVRTLRLPVSGEGLTSAIVDTLHVSPEQAEKTKRTCGLDPALCQGALQAILEPPIALLAERVHEMLHSVHEDEGARVSTCVVVGGGAQMPALGSFLEKRLEIPVVALDVLSGLHHAKDCTLPADTLGFATAIGLALRAATPV